VAIDLISRILSPLFVMILWSNLFIFSALYFGFLCQTQSNLGRLRQGLAIVLLIYGLLILVGASQGNINPWLPLSHIPNIQATSSMILVTSTDEAELALSRAHKEGKPVMIDFYADWCRSCKILEKKIHHNAAIQSALAAFIVIKADISENNEKTTALSQRFNVIAPPTFIFIDTEGKSLEQFRFVGEISLDKLNHALRQTLRIKKKIKYPLSAS
jgi:thiol:disulfide interchange protein DsbD